MHTVLLQKEIIVRLFPLAIAALSLASCATAPVLDTAGAVQDINPPEAVANPEAYQGQSVVWGGIIISNKSLAEGTMLEVLAYPLSDNLEPKIHSRPLGRFIVQAETFLEPIDYSQGRQITAVGSITKTTTGMIGEAEYTYPVLHPKQIHLWPREKEVTGGVSTGSFFGFGIGIGL